MEHKDYFHTRKTETTVLDEQWEPTALTGVTAMCMDPSGLLGAFGSQNGILDIWEVSVVPSHAFSLSLGNVFSNGNNFSCRLLTWSTDSTHVLGAVVEAGDHCVRNEVPRIQALVVWNILSRELKYFLHLPFAVSSVSFLPGSSELVVMYNERLQLSVVNLSTSTLYSSDRSLNLVDLLNLEGTPMYSSKGLAAIESHRTSPCQGTCEVLGKLISRQTLDADSMAVHMLRFSDSGEVYVDSAEMDDGHTSRKLNSSCLVYDLKYNGEGIKRSIQFANLQLIPIANGDHYLVLTISSSSIESPQDANTVVQVRSVSSLELIWTNTSDLDHDNAMQPMTIEEVHSPISTNVICGAGRLPCGDESALAFAICCSSNSGDGLCLLRYRSEQSRFFRYTRSEAKLAKSSSRLKYVEFSYFGNLAIGMCQSSPKQVGCDVWICRQGMALEFHFAGVEYPLGYTYTKHLTVYKEKENEFDLSVIDASQVDLSSKSSKLKRSRASRDISKERCENMLEYTRDLNAKICSDYFRSFKKARVIPEELGSAECCNGDQHVVQSSQGTSRTAIYAPASASDFKRFELDLSAKQVGPKLVSVGPTSLSCLALKHGATLYDPTKVALSESRKSALKKDPKLGRHNMIGAPPIGLAYLCDSYRPRIDYGNGPVEDEDLKSFLSKTFQHTIGDRLMTLQAELQIERSKKNTIASRIASAQNDANKKALYVEDLKRREKEHQAMAAMRTAQLAARRAMQLAQKNEAIRTVDAASCIDPDSKMEIDSSMVIVHNEDAAAAPESIVNEFNLEEPNVVVFEEVKPDVAGSVEQHPSQEEMEVVEDLNDEIIRRAPVESGRARRDEELGIETEYFPLKTSPCIELVTATADNHKVLSTVENLNDDVIRRASIDEEYRIGADNASLQTSPCIELMTVIIGKHEVVSTAENQENGVDEKGRQRKGRGFLPHRSHYYVIVMLK